MKLHRGCLRTPGDGKIPCVLKLKGETEVLTLKTSPRFAENSCKFMKTKQRARNFCNKLIITGVASRVLGHSLFYGVVFIFSSVPNMVNMNLLKSLVLFVVLHKQQI